MLGLAWRALRGALGAAFSPGVLAGAGLALIAAWSAFVWHEAASRARAECQAAAIAAELAGVRQDLAAARAAAALAAAQSDDRQALAERLARERDDYATALAARPAARACLLDSDDVRRLRSAPGPPGRS
jgi:thiol:disulfide interchange protein